MFDPPWAPRSAKLNWYMQSPGPQYPRLGATANSPCGVVKTRNSQNFNETLHSNITLVGMIPEHELPPITCTKGLGKKFNALEYSANKQHPECNDEQKCPSFKICDYRYGASGKCSEPNLSTMAS